MNENLKSYSDLSHALENLNPGRVPVDVFNQIARLTVTPVLEVVPFYRDEMGNIKVFLLRRKADDLLWSNMYHIPGTILRATDTAGSFSDAKKRISSTLLKGLDFNEFIFTDVIMLKVSRGTEVAILYSIELISTPDKLFLFDPKDLPNNIIEGQAEMIAIALDSFTNN